MKVPMLRESICGCSLETGAKYSARLSLATAIFKIITIAKFWNAKAITEQVQEHKSTAFDSYSQFFYYYMILTSICVSIYLIPSIAVVYGVYKKKPKFMLPYIILKTVLIIVHLIASIILVSYYVMPAITIVLVTGVPLLYLYPVLILYSYYRVLNGEVADYVA